MTTPLRVFLAISLPAPVRGAIAAATAPMRGAARDLAWVAEGHLHLTLKFLGEQPASAVDALRDALAPPLARIVPMALEVGGLGAFPNLRAPRVVWMGIAADARLELLHHDIELIGAALGYELEGRPFRPHITLARARTPLAEGPARALRSAAKMVQHRSRAPVNSVEIMASRLGPGGAHYTTLASLALAGGS